MRVFRICRKAYAALDGVGGIYTSGRWHVKGHPVVYTATSAALAALEVLVHVDPLNAPSDLQLLTVDLPPHVSSETIDPTSLPKRWSAVPAPRALQRLGTAWLTALRSAALVVPSAIIPIERNVLLNPQHPDSVHVRIVARAPFTFDTRLL
jgi:RES domain-containing protein